MPSKQDLVEADSFRRRRLVTAFVSGAPDARGGEPARPGRTILGGLVLAALLAVGAAVAGHLAPAASDDWQERGLIVSQETGAAYVITGEDGDTALHPIANSTSATLILGADLAPTVVAQEDIEDHGIGDELGIRGAPASLPSPPRLIADGWTACIADGGGLRVTVSADPDVTALTEGGVTVTSGGEVFAIIGGAAGAHVHPVPRQPTPRGDQRDNLLTAIGLAPSIGAAKAPRTWLDLFPRGAPLSFSSFGIERFGQRADRLDPLADAGRVGDLLVTTAGQQLLLADEGPVLLSDFEAAVYRWVVTPDGDVVRPRVVEMAPGGEQAQLPGDTRWPRTPLASGRPTVAGPCAQLVPTPDGSPVVRLAQAGASTGATDPGAGELAPGELEQHVDPGAGAYVRTGSAAGTAYLIAATGRAHPLEGEDTAERLGYADQPATVVPEPWVELFACGVALSQDAALSPPGEDEKCG